MQLFSRVFIVGVIRCHDVPESLAVIHFKAMRQLMYGDVVNERDIAMDKSPVQPDVTSGCTGTPSCSGIGKTECTKGNIHAFGLKFKPFCKDRSGLLHKPVFEW